MKQEDFKLIKTDFNTIIDTINKTKINGRAKYYSKFKDYDHHIKNTIEIPKVKTYTDQIEYDGIQCLESDEFHWESSSADFTKLNLGIFCNFTTDDYKIYFKIRSINDRYSPAFEIKPTDEILFDESYTSCDFIDFIKIFEKMYFSLVSNSKNLFSNAEDTAKISDLVSSIIRKLEGQNE